MKRLVIALGGNALGNNPEEQLELVKQTAKTIVDLSEEGYNVIVGHGNGPQVGMINLAMDFASSNGANTPSMPFAECGSMSQGYIGYHLQQQLQNFQRTVPHIGIGLKPGGCLYLRSCISDGKAVISTSQHLDIV